MITSDGKLEPVLILLSILVVFFTILVLFCSWMFPMDGQTFQVVSGLVTGFSGALLMRVKPRGQDGGDTTIINPPSNPQEPPK